MDSNPTIPDRTPAIVGDGQSPVPDIVAGVSYPGESRRRFYYYAMCFRTFFYRRNPTAGKFTDSVDF